jgi:hypothetical protein
MPQSHSFLRPDLGDIFVRRNLNGNEEEAMIVSVMYNPKASLWQATMNTKNGVEFVTGDKEFRNIHDWRPKHYVFDDQNGNWYAPAEKEKLDAERAKAEAAKAAAAQVASAEKDEYLVADAAEAPNAIKKRGLPKVGAIPSLPSLRV